MTGTHRFMGIHRKGAKLDGLMRVDGKETGICRGAVVRCICDNSVESLVNRRSGRGIRLPPGRAIGESGTDQVCLCFFGTAP